MANITYVGEDDKVALDDISAEPPKGAERAELEPKTDKLGEELTELQDLLWGARTRGVMIVLQGRDTAGKDGAIKKVVGFLNPRGVGVTSFGVPHTIEREHDYLWRVHQVAPRKGEVAVYNRSHYEDVLVVRVHGLAPEKKWKKRYRHIREWEQLLVDEGTIIVKYFLHISKDEQKKRLLEREADPTKAWKLNQGDWEEREHWKDYTEAYEDALSKTASKDAPWIVVAANSKWYRNYVITKTLVEALRPYRDEFEQTLEGRAAERKEQLALYRKERAAKGEKVEGA